MSAVGGSKCWHGLIVQIDWLMGDWGRSNLRPDAKKSTNFIAFLESARLAQ
jgi:hypothetical protein